MNCCSLLSCSFFLPTFTVVSEIPKNFRPNLNIPSPKLPTNSSVQFHPLLRNSLLPLAASLCIIISPIPAEAGLFSGFSGIESTPGPQLPQIDFLNRLNEENQKKYAQADARFKSSPLVKQLLERSKLNKEKNRQAILDKYCIRGAEWGVGDCSAEAMSPEERENFIDMLKQKAGITK